MEAGAAGVESGGSSRRWAVRQWSQKRRAHSVLPHAIMLVARLTCSCVHGCAAEWERESAGWGVGGREGENEKEREREGEGGTRWNV